MRTMESISSQEAFSAVHRTSDEMSAGLLNGHTHEQQVAALRELRDSDVVTSRRAAHFMLDTLLPDAQLPEWEDAFNTVYPTDDV